MAGAIAVTVEFDKPLNLLTAYLSAWPDALQYQLALHLEEFKIALYEQIQRVAMQNLKGTTGGGFTSKLMQIDYKSAAYEIARLKAEAAGAIPGGMYANVQIDGPTQVNNPGHIQIQVQLPYDKFPYARIIEEGGVVPPHFIQAVNAQVLAFQGWAIPTGITQAGGRVKSQLDVVPVSAVAFARFIPEHPGAAFPGYQVIAKALESMQGEYEDLILTAISQTVGGVVPEGTPPEGGDSGGSGFGLVKGPRRT